MEQGYDDPYILTGTPPHLEKLTGTAKKFLIRFGKQENEYYKSDFVVSAIIDEIMPQSLVNQIQADIPLTPSPTPQIVAATPITSSQSHLTETTLKTSKCMKRKLFSELNDITPHR
ncbi:hypothetical protein Ddye_004421 [Dipteronia dyeriana]|uniref:Uncharacterized protein n=1 Tax=Dipteronia dyeriana TaxID=168575 RepID=A0AAE0CW79_9ROSI|nr:hypothetical protein Ddye_004421 [Dipteronia dyeriana]